MAEMRSEVEKHAGGLAEARAIDTARRLVTLDSGEIAYDFLILATGVTHAYFGHDDWEAHAPGLKTLDDALRMRRRVLIAFEKAERVSDPDARRRLLTFAIVGGGPTGVELAGAIAEMARHTLAHEFRSFDPACARVVLVEAAPGSSRCTRSHFSARRCGPSGSWGWTF